MNKLIAALRIVIINLWMLISTGDAFCQKPVPDSLKVMRFSGKELYKPCLDTIRFLFFKKVIDYDLVTPAWKPIYGNDIITPLEGTVADGLHGIRGPHVSEEDFPNYHYTHDFCFNILPDSAFRNLLCYFDEKGEWKCRPFVHCEWETGMANGNATHPYREIMSQGGSMGFMSYGHERKKPLISWPAPGDWVHIEGIHVWDRGHPPAKTEIHPTFLAFIKRKNLVIFQNRLAHRIDIIANGDGSAFYNNLPNTPGNVFKPAMNQKDYVISIHAPFLLNNYDIHTENHVNTHGLSIQTTHQGDSIYFTLPWKTTNTPNDAKFIQTIYLVPKRSTDLNDYKKAVVHLQQIRIKRKMDFLRKPQFRVWANIHQRYYFLNEWSPSQDILNDGWGKGLKRKWKLNLSDTIYVHQDSLFRVQFNAWEADGPDFTFGELLNQNCDCNDSTQLLIRKKLIHPRMFFRGCKDDVLREGLQFHRLRDIKQKQTFTLTNQGEKQEDPCPFSHYDPSNTLQLTYSIEILED